MWRFLFLVLALGAAIGFFAKPAEDKAEELLGEMILEAINRQDISLEKSAAGNALLLGCKLRPSDCLNLLRSQLTTQYDDYKVFSTYAAQGLGHKAWCIGAFTTLTCPGGLQPN